MLKVGLTGGIGSGKSTVAKIFETLHVPVYYADQAAKEIIEKDVEVRQSIINLLGTDAFLPDGTYNKTFVAKKVFQNKALLHELNKIVHPKTLAHNQQWFKQQQAPYAIKEAALLFEADVAKYLDVIITVIAPENIRIERVKDRDKADENTIKNRMDKQLPQDVLIAKSDFIINNDGIEALLPQVMHIHKKLLERVEESQI